MSVQQVDVHTENGITVSRDIKPCWNATVIDILISYLNIDTSCTQKVRFL